MRTTVRYWVIIATLLSTVIGPSKGAFAGCSRTLTFANADWIPNINPETKFVAHQLDRTMLTRIMKIAGCKFTHRSLPFTRLLIEIERGTLDGTTTASITAERTRYAKFSVPYRKEIIVMFMRKDEVARFRPKTVADLLHSEHRYAVDFNSWYGKEFAALRDNYPTFNARLLSSNGLDLKFDWLVRNRVDIVISDLHFGHYLLKRNSNLDKVSAHPLLINREDVHFMLSKKSVLEADLAVINKAIETFRASEEYDVLLRKFIGS